MKLKQAVRFAKMNSRITPKITPWLVNNPNGVHITDPKIYEKISGILMPKVSKSRAGAFHPSQLYQCQRAQVYGYHNAPTIREYNPILQNLFNDGHFRHLRWQIMLLEAGVLSDVEVAVYSSEHRIEGSMDGINSEEKWMFELKGTSQFKSIQAKGAMPAHIKQVHAYLLASGLEEAAVVYECKSTQQWTEIPIHRDPKIIQEIKEILLSLNDAITHDYLPERLEDCENKTGSTYNSCAYSQICHGCNNPSDIVTLRSHK
jgi:hypothetical protein